MGKRMLVVALPGGLEGRFDSPCSPGVRGRISGPRKSETGDEQPEQYGYPAVQSHSGELDLASVYANG